MGWSVMPPIRRAGSDCENGESNHGQSAKIGAGVARLSGNGLPGDRRAGPDGPLSLERVLRRGRQVRLPDPPWWRAPVVLRLPQYLHWVLHREGLRVGDEFFA